MERQETIRVWIAGKPYDIPKATESQLQSVEKAAIPSRYTMAVQMFVDLAAPTLSRPAQREAVKKEISAYYGQPLGVYGAIVRADISQENLHRIELLVEEIAQKSQDTAV